MSKGLGSHRWFGHLDDGPRPAQHCDHTPDTTHPKTGRAGYLTIIGRLKELIIRGGYNVYPREVEDALYEHAQVAEVAVIGVPDDYYGEEIAAIVALTPDASTSQDALRAWAKERLSAYKVPRILQFVDELPKGPTGKILKRAIDPRSYPELAGRTQSS